MKIESIEGCVDVLHKLSDEEGNRYYSLWTYDLNELENIFELDINGEYQLIEVIEEYANVKTDNIIQSNNPKDVNMVVYDINEEDIDNTELDLKWEGYAIEQINIEYVKIV